jgi:acyl-CoA synthetase (AMP-forming)/AMP-acid ligase II
VDPRCPPSVADITLRCRERLARYKVPVEFSFVESLPRTASGKLLR